jgi:uncharacterized protein (DUF2267 family)
MDYDGFIEIVEQAAHLDRAGAERAARATLQTLGERIVAGEARHLATELPPELAPFLSAEPEAEAFGVVEFIRRVADREGVDPQTAERHAAAVFVALHRAVSPKELSDVLAELPLDEYARLLPRGPAVEVMPADRFLELVAERAGLDRDGAWRVTAAVLETLAERIAGGEVEDLVNRLDVQMHAPLRRGDARTRGQATRMSLDEFAERVAERTGTDPLVEARDHIRAVLATLREAVGDEEFVDVTVQLPHEFDAVLAR